MMFYQDIGEPEQCPMKGGGILAVLKRLRTYTVRGLMPPSLEKWHAVTTHPDFAIADHAKELYSKVGIDRVEKLVKAYEEGRVDILACVPGTRVFRVVYNTDACYHCDQYSAGDIDYWCWEEYDMCPTVYKDPKTVCPKFYPEVREGTFQARDNKHIGKSVFLNLEDADFKAKLLKLNVKEGDKLYCLVEDSVLGRHEGMPNPYEVIARFEIWENGHILLKGVGCDGKHSVFIKSADFNNTVFKTLAAACAALRGKDNG